MPPRKGHVGPNRKERFDIVLGVLSGNPRPLRVPDLVDVLRAAGYEISGETPKKWPIRGIPEKWARRIALLPRAVDRALTADWIIDGKGPPPDVPSMGRAAPVGTMPSAARQQGTTSEPRTKRSEAGYLLRALTAQDAGLRLQVSEAGAGYADLAAIAANLAGQMLAERVAAIFKHTFQHNEIANTVAGRAFTIAFLERVVDEFGALGLNVTDMARYIIELRRSDGPRK